MELGMVATNNWEGAERFQHTDYLVFNETGRQGTITLGGGRTVSGMLISDVNYTFTGGDLFGVGSRFEYGGGAGDDVNGDLIIGGTDGTPQRLGTGTSGQLLTATSSGPQWKDPPETGGGSGFTEYDPNTDFIQVAWAKDTTQILGSAAQNIVSTHATLTLPAGVWDVTGRWFLDASWSVPVPDNDAEIFSLQTLVGLKIVGVDDPLTLTNRSHGSATECPPIRVTSTGTTVVAVEVFAGDMPVVGVDVVDFSYSAIEARRVR